MQTERLMITMAAGILAAATFFYFWEISSKWRTVGISLVLLTGFLLGYYWWTISDASHGIGILILPIVTLWLVWRQRFTGKPKIRPALFVILQCLFTLIFIILVYCQEH